MTTTTGSTAFVRNTEDLERRWFYGGGIHTCLASSTDTAGQLLVNRVSMVQDKVTPLHTHPVDESLYVLEGELLIHLDGEQHRLRAGGYTLAPAGVPHAFKVLSETATVLDIHPSGACEAFYLGASEPLAPGATDGPVDFDKIAESGRLNGGFELLGPPPF